MYERENRDHGIEIEREFGFKYPQCNIEVWHPMYA